MDLKPMPMFKSNKLLAYWKKLGTLSTSTLTINEQNKVMIRQTFLGTWLHFVGMKLFYEKYKCANMVNIIDNTRLMQTFLSNFLNNLSF